MTSTALSTGRDPIELVADRLYALGDTVELDGRVSWAPERPGRSQAVSCYLLREGDDTLLVDTGVRVLWPTIEAQLRTLVTPGAAMKVFITRPELDSVGNLPLLRDRYAIEDTDVMAGGSDNPFDFFDSAASRAVAGSAAAGSSVPPRTGGGHSVLRTTGFDLGPDRPVRIVVPKLRFLPTYWPFDYETGTLFTSDIFTHVEQEAPHTLSVLGSEAPARGLDSDVAGHLFSKFWWLPGAVTAELRDDLASIFDRLAPEMVAPAYGGVLRGRGVVRTHLDALLALLDACPGMLGGEPR